MRRAVWYATLQAKEQSRQAEAGNGQPPLERALVLDERQRVSWIVGQHDAHGIRRLVRALQVLQDAGHKMVDPATRQRKPFGPGLLEARHVIVDGQYVPQPER